MAYQYTGCLESERLVTRQAVAGDFTERSAFFIHREATQFIPAFDLPAPQLRARHWIEKQVYRYENNRDGLHVLISRYSGKIVGRCGLLLQDVNGAPEIGIGYHLQRSEWGKGYATQAATASKDFALGHGLAPSLVSLIHVDNVRSQKVAERNGMGREKKIKWSGKNIFLYRISNK
jgi:RimJ/RimL family protein N-acetyltransferase